MLGIRVFFSVYIDEKAEAKQNLNIRIADNLASEVLDPLRKIPAVKEADQLKNATVCLSVIRETREEPKEEKKEVAVKKEEEKKDDNQEKRKLEMEALVGGYPMEKMIPAMLSLDEKTSAFLVAIAKKESDWGVHSPTKKGNHCYNYWGFKGAHNLTESGYSCFDSPEQAVEMVGGKIEDLIAKKFDTPERMVVWKCGSSCASHDPKSVQKWISDVRNYMVE